MTSWSGKSVVVIGAARQGLALARYLAQQGASVTLNDRRLLVQLENAAQGLAGLGVKLVGDGHPLSLLEGADLVCPSGGIPLDIPLVAEALRRGIPMSNDSQIFLEAAPCKVIGITGSAGKTTTTTLVGRIAEQALAMDAANPGRKVWVGGNIGNPLISVVDQMQAHDLAVMELSSFQLEQMTKSPQVAAVLNITPNHLDRHGTMQAYMAAKRRMVEFQTSQDTAVLGCADPGAWGLKSWVRGKLVSFGFSRPEASQDGAFLDGESLKMQVAGEVLDVLSRRQIALRGDHNVLNVLAATALTWSAGLPLAAVAAGVEGFRGVAHRLELVRELHGVKWYNDSIATAPERSMAALRSFQEPLVLLAGGRDKDLPWDEFAQLVVQRVDHLVLFGEAAGLIERCVRQAAGGSNLSLVCTQSLQEAVQAAALLVEPGDVVLLSPGGTSFDEFRDFEDRGEAYRKWVQELL